ncbi:MAG: AAA family ATPase [Nitrospira sp.]
MTTRALAPEHLKDLARSGLTDVLEQLQCESVRPHDINVHGVQSAYRIPYFTLDGNRNCFERWRLFPVVQRADGTKQKYYQPPGTDPNLYLPPLFSWQAIARQPRTTVLFVEGEKKAAAGCAKGLFAIGVAGLWNWRQKLDDGKPLMIPTVDQFQWKNREVLLVPDSDAWHADRELDLLAGFYALGQELISRGAVVRLVRLPETGSTKTGLDDWLLSVGQQWESFWPLLERLPLDDERLKRLAAWWQKWRAKHTDLDACRTRSAETPEVENVGDVLSFRWPNLNAIAILERFSEKSGSLSAELTVKLIQGSESIPLISYTKINLTAERTRQSTAKSLAEKSPTQPWGRMIEIVCQQAIEIHRQGEPLVVVGPDLRSTVTSQRLHPLVYDGVPTVLYGPGGNGKSYLTHLFSFLVAHGGYVGPFCGIPGPVLYLDYETDLDVFVDRSARLRKGHPEFAGTELLYQRCHMPLALDLPSIQRRVAEHGVKFVVVDSVAPACGGELERPESAIQLFSALRKLRVSSLLIAHTQKNSEEKTPFGTVFFTNYPRSVWEIQKVQDVNESQIKVALHQRKNNLGPLHAPVGLQVFFGNDETRMESLSLLDEPQLSSGLSLAARLKHTLKGGAKTIEALSEDLGTDRAQIRARLNEGNGKWSQKVGDDRWGLVSHEK